MTKKLSDKQREIIEKDAGELGVSKAARKNGVCNTTVRNILASANKLPCGGKKSSVVNKQNNVLKSDMNAREKINLKEKYKKKAERILTLCFKALTEPEKLSSATPSQVISVMNAVIDKFLQLEQEDGQEFAEVLEKLWQARISKQN